MGVISLRLVWAMCCEAAARIWKRDFAAGFRGVSRLSCGWILCFDANLCFLGRVDLLAVGLELGPTGCVSRMNDTSWNVNWSLWL